MFKELFDAVIDDHHRGFGPKDMHPAPELDASTVTNHTHIVQTGGGHGQLRHMHVYNLRDGKQTDVWGNTFEC